MKLMNRLPKEDLSSGQIAEFLGVSRKTITSYYEKVKQAYYWLNESELSYGASNQKRYTEFCVAAIEDLFASENHQKWINDIQSSHKNNLSESGGEIVSLAIPDDVVEIVEVEVIDSAEIKKYDLSKFTQANLTNIENLRTNNTNRLKALEEATKERFRMMGKVAAQKAIHAYTEAFNEEINSLSPED
jgi:predicted transcriptional regulator